MNWLTHFLVPHHTNNHKAKIIRPSGLSLVLVFVLLFQFAIRGVAVVNPQVLGFAANISPDEVIRLTNEKRAQNGLPPVTHNAQLSQAAQQKAADMLNKDYWAHVSPDGTQPWHFFSNVGYKYKYAGENLARDFSNPSATVDAWMASPTHRDNLLSNKYKEIGIAVIEGDLAGVDTTIVVQLFGTRAGDSLPVQPVAAATNTTPKPVVTATKKPVAATKAPTAVPIQKPEETIAQAQPASALPTPTPIMPSNKVLVSPLNITKTASGAIIAVLLAVLLIDMVVIARRRISRVSSRSFAHFAFFAMIIAIIVIAKAGSIL